ncbi:MAG: hypothetical protein KZQ70_14235 [gamma proteobacterium symbiont of Lucinoma myriamae]|nr:hypothetical protein [gamma proteobacterium symbiont of Lucinoma myriamae]MCU7833415.1 hypothetical protein [gamma proteobacterium symbiont of Lucinoma myriamae]
MITLIVQTGILLIPAPLSGRIMKKNVLIIEDDVDIANLIKLQLLDLN